MKAEDAAYIRGYVAAVAAIERRSTSIVGLLRSINADAALLEDAGVDAFDIEPLRPALQRIRKNSRARWRRRVERNKRRRDEG